LDRTRIVDEMRALGAAKRAAEAAMGEAEENLMGAKALETTLEAAVATQKANAESAAAACAAAEAREARLGAELKAATAELQRSKQLAALALHQVRGVHTDGLPCMQALTTARVSPRCTRRARS
jgi:multidrug resistance efflux pump